MRVTKIMCLLFCLTLILTNFCSCKEKEKLDVNTISEELIGMCLSGQETLEVNKSDIENRFNFDGNILGESKIQMSNDEEKFLLVAVMQLKHKKDKQTVIDGINGSLKAASASFSVLGEEKLSKIQQRLFYEYDDILIVVVAENYEAATKYLEKIEAKKII